MSRIRIAVAVLLLFAPQPPLLLLLPSSSSAFSYPSPAPSPPSSSSSSSSYPRDRLSRIPVVICPGFGNDSVDYVSPLGRDPENGFVAALERRGFSSDLIRVVPIRRYEWLRVAGGLFDVPDFYLGTCRPTGLGYGWYVERLRRVIECAYDDGGRDERVILVGHSAGGWLARAALGDGSWDVDDRTASSSSSHSSNDDDDDRDASTATTRAADRVRALITIGAIHRPPASSASVSGGSDDDDDAGGGGGPSSCVTRGALAYVDANYPGAYHSGEGIAYVSVGGDAVIGRKRRSSRSIREEEERGGTRGANEIYEIRGEGSASSVAYTSYTAVGGNGETTGDGVVPVDWTLLEGSRTIVLDGVLHSINEAGTTMPTDRWYGAEDVVDRWLYDALEEAGIVVGESKRRRTDDGGGRGGFFSLDRFMDIFNATSFRK